MPDIVDKESLWRFNAGFLSARIGEWIYAISLNWLVLQQSSSPWLLAVVNACRLAPALLLSVPAGYLADHYDSRRLSYWNNLLNATVMMLVGTALTLQLPILTVCALVLLQAALSALEAPIRNAYMNGLFEGSRLKAAIAQNASLMNLGRILGPVLAGFLLARQGGLASFGADCDFRSRGSGGKLCAGPTTRPLDLASHPALRRTVRFVPGRTGASSRFRLGGGGALSGRLSGSGLPFVQPYAPARGAAQGGRRPDPWTVLDGPRDDPTGRPDAGRHHRAFRSSRKLRGDEFGLPALGADVFSSWLSGCLAPA